MVWGAAVGFMGGYSLEYYRISTLGGEFTWNVPGVSRPTKKDNVSVADWKQNIRATLMKHIQEKIGLPQAQKHYWKGMCFLLMNWTPVFIHC